MTKAGVEKLAGGYKPPPPPWKRGKWISLTGSWSNAMTNIGATVCAVVSLLCACSCSPQESGSRQNAASATNAGAENSVEYKLAVVDKGGYVSPDDVAVARFRSLLQQLDSKFNETPERIADMSVAGRNTLRDKGISESILNIMEGMNQVLDAPLLSSTGVNKQEYADYLALYIVQRDAGRSREAVIAGLRGLVR
jgi:hypothetical protein